MNVFRVNWQWLPGSCLWENVDRKENSSNLGGKKCVYKAATSKRIYYLFV